MNLCRFCAEKSPSLVKGTIFDNSASNKNILNGQKSILEMLEIFKNIKVIENHNLPNQICIKCFEDLKNAYIFYAKLLKSQEEFNRLLKDEKSPTHHSENLKPLILPKSENISWTCKKCVITFSLATQFLNHLEESHMPEVLHSCCLCTDKFKSKIRLEIHIKRCHINQYTCTFCNTWFSSSQLVAEHIKTSHKTCQYQCKICSCEIRSRKELNKHYGSEHLKLPNTCNLYCAQCSHLRFNSFYELSFHIHNIHQKEHSTYQWTNTNTLKDITPTFPIADDNEMFMDEEFLEEMNEEFLDEIFNQENDDSSFQFTESWLDLDFMGINDYSNKTLSKICDIDSDNGKQSEKLFVNTSGEKYTEKNSLLDVVKEKFNCPKCTNHEFNLLSDLKTHLAAAHDEYCFVCNTCGCKFNRKEDYNLHLSQHLTENMIIKSQNENQQLHYEDKKVECKQCFKKFSKERNFLLHICKLKNQSTEEAKPLICTLCNSQFKSHKEAYKHKKETHNNVTSTLECILCDKVFKTKAGLEYHLKVHTGFKSFTCPYCEKTFTANTNLNFHIRSNHGTVKCHECELCDKKFFTLDHLKKHVTSIHQKERNHICEICRKGFNQKSHLKQHELIHSGEKRFYCEHCLKGFIKRSEMVKHLMKCSQK